ncbi:MAG: hypothetical protein SOX70_05865 [Peptoniphilaceae bacterium]|nr:hypothetical protein [Peptoniphilaceae bacterium]
MGGKNHGGRKFKTVISERLQVFFNLLTFSGEPTTDGMEEKLISKDYMRRFSAMMQEERFDLRRSLSGS